MLKIVYSRTARFISYLLPTFIMNCHMFQRSHLSILLLLLAFSILISTAYILTLYSSQTLPLLSSQVLAEQQNSKLLNLKQINLHLNLIGSTTTGITNGAVNFLQTYYKNDCQISYLPTETGIYPQSNNLDCQLCLRLMLYQLENIANSYPDYLKIIKE